jgi:hypothetical protein
MRRLLHEGAIFAEFELEDNDGELTRSDDGNHLALARRTADGDAERHRIDSRPARVDEIDADPVPTRYRGRQPSLLEPGGTGRCAAAARIVGEHGSGARAAIAEVERFARWIGDVEVEIDGRGPGQRDV